VLQQIQCADIRSFLRFVSGLPPDLPARRAFFNKPRSSSHRSGPPSHKHRSQRRRDRDSRQFLAGPARRRGSRKARKRQ